MIFVICKINMSCNVSHFRYYISGVRVNLKISDVSVGRKRQNVIIIVINVYNNFLSFLNKFLCKKIRGSLNPYTKKMPRQTNANAEKISFPIVTNC